VNIQTIIRKKLSPKYYLFFYQGLNRNSKGP